MSAPGRGWPYDPVGGPPSAPASRDAIEGPPVAVVEGPEPAFSRRAVVLLCLGGALAMVLASLGIGDWYVRNREMRTLLTRIEQAERAQLPAFQSIHPLLRLCRQEATTDDDEELCDTVSIRLSAERILPKLQETGDEVAATRLTSYHGDLRSFRDRYVDHYLAWRGWLETLAQDPTAGGFTSPGTITSTFQAANDAADQALTPLPLYDNRDRVEVIFQSVRT